MSVARMERSVIRGQPMPDYAAAPSGLQVRGYLLGRGIIYEAGKSEWPHDRRRTAAMVD